MGRRHDDRRVELEIIVDDGPTRAPGRREASPAVRTPAALAVRGRTLAALAAVTVAIGVSVAVASDSGDTGSGDTDGPPPTTRPPVLWPIPAPGPEGGSDDLASGLPLDETRTVVGTIEWSRHDGGRDLPARIDVDASGALVGVDGDVGRLLPIDAASRWQRLATVERVISDDLWRQNGGGGSTGLGIVTPIGRRTIELTDLVEPVPAGFVATVEPVAGLADGFPIELGDDVFLLAETRVGLPWADIATAVPDGSYRVRLSDGDRSIGIAEGRFNELPVEEFHLVGGGGTTHHVEDAAGEQVWSFETDAAVSGLESAAGRFETTWMQWNGSRFVAVDRPWPDGHDVDMVQLAGGVLARADGPLHRDVALWFSGDGRAWQRVDMPAERLERTPVAVVHDGALAIVTLFTSDGLEAWATADGTRFEQLPDVPGMAARHRGDFGWVAADPRSAPTLRLSADGDRWEELDLGPLLDLDASRWDVTITAAAVHDRIVVVADRPDGRSVLVGTVTPPRPG